MDQNRRTAFHTLLRMEQDESYSNIELNHQIGRLKPDDPAFTRALVYTVIERKYYLDYLLDQLIRSGVTGQKPEVRVLLRMGAGQILFMDSVPDYAACSETVTLARKYSPGQAKFVNGVLRSLIRKRETLRYPKEEPDLVKRLSAEYSYEPWIVRLWIGEYGTERAEKLLSAGNQIPPLSIRVNTCKTTPDELMIQLSDRGITVSQSVLSPRILLIKGEDVTEDPGYLEGLFSIQDTASVLAIEALAPEPGETVADVCGAPGGKSFAAAEIMEDTGRIITMDRYENKIRRVRAEAGRLGHSIVEARVRDAREPAEDLYGICDRVICDVPCSGLGVIRRRPEIKYKVLEDQGKELSELQYQILTASDKYLKAGGVLLYSTCTINHMENCDVIRRFLQEHVEYEQIKSEQLLPDGQNTDGFFYCKLRKKHNI